MRQPEVSPETLPNEYLQLIDGSTYHLTKGKPVVIHFWATWCRVCKMESDNIDRLARKYEVITIAVNSGSDDEIRNYMEQQGVHFNVYNDNEGRWAKRFGVEVFPTTFIYDAKGVLRFTEVGYTTTAGLMTRLKLVKP